MKGMGVGDDDGKVDDGRLIELFFLRPSLPSVCYYTLCFSCAVQFGPGCGNKNSKKDSHKVGIPGYISALT
jgi:hypothetical protein